MKNNTILKDTFVLFMITVIAGLILGGVHELTKDGISESVIAANRKAYETIFPDAADFKSNDELSNSLEAVNEELLTREYGSVGVEQVFQAVDQSGAILGYVVTSYSKDSYEGLVRLLVGVNADKTVKAIELLELNDTPGLGQNAKKPEFKDQFVGQSKEPLTVSKSGSGADGEIEAISGATITSNAVTNAVNAALYVMNHIGEK